MAKFTGNYYHKTKLNWRVAKDGHRRHQPYPSHGGLSKGDDAIFAATGVTDGELLRGVQFKGSVGTTQSLVMRAKSGTVRFVDGRHSLNKNRTWLLSKSGGGLLRREGIGTPDEEAFCASQEGVK